MRLESSSGILGAWWRQGARTAFLLRPSWSGLKTSPLVIAALIATPYLLGILIERLYIVGDATFTWFGLQTGWLSTALTLWVCWLAVPSSSVSAAEREAPSALALFSMLLAQVLTMQALLAAICVPLARAGLFASQPFGAWAWWAASIVPPVWGLIAESKLTWQSSTQRYHVRAAALLLLTGATVLSLWARPTFWYASDAGGDEARSRRFELTQQIMEQQPKLLSRQLDELAAQRSGLVDVYAITYAPYADEDVFRRESAMVADVMEKRFDAHARTVQLVNHRQTAGDFAWATPLNLQRAIDKMASLMNRDEDILFVHLTSHGARDGTLSAHFWPLTVDAVTPTMIKGWLDAAKVRYRIVSVSACYSGSWIGPLETAGTLVMTASDAEHTSYGCGKRSELTYFGRAMFDEQLRGTWSFEDAHASARVSIEEREREAGKTDGFSNPQIRVGDDMRSQLARLAKERAALSPR
jgi:hypothetical protein